MDKVPNNRKRELCGVTKGIDNRIGFSLVERTENDRIAKTVYV